MTSTTRNIIAFICCLLWSTAFMFNSIALQYLSPLHIVSVRLSLVTIITAIITRRNSFKVFKSDIKWILLVSLFHTVVNFTFFIFAMTMISGSLTAFLKGINPAMGSIIAVLLLRKEKLSSNLIIALIIGVVGVGISIIFSKNFDVSSYSVLIGVSLILVSNILSGISSVVIKSKLSKYKTKDVQLVQVTIGTIIIIIISLVIDGPVDFTKFANIDLSLSMIALAAISSIAITLWVHLIKDDNSKLTLINVWKFIIPTMGAIFSWIFIASDKFEPIALVSLICSGLAVIISQVKLDRNKKLN